MAKPLRGSGSWEHVRAPRFSWFFSDPELARDVRLTVDVAGVQKASTIHSANTALAHTTAH